MKRDTREATTSAVILIFLIFISLSSIGCGDWFSVYDDDARKEEEGESGSKSSYRKKSGGILIDGELIGEGFIPEGIELRSFTMAEFNRKSHYVFATKELLYILPAESGGAIKEIIKIGGDIFKIMAADLDGNGWSELFIGMQGDYPDAVIDLYHGENLRISDHYFGVFFPMTTGEWIKGGKNEMIGVYCQRTGDYYYARCWFSVGTIKHARAGDWRLIYLDGLELYYAGSSDFSKLINPMMVGDFDGDGKSEVLISVAEPRGLYLYDILKIPYKEPPAMLVGSPLDCADDARSCPSEEQCCDVEGHKVCLSGGCFSVGQSAIYISGFEICPDNYEPFIIDGRNGCLLKCGGDDLAWALGGCLERGAKLRGQLFPETDFFRHHMAAGDLDKDGKWEIYTYETKVTDEIGGLAKARFIAVEMASDKNMVLRAKARSEWLGEFSESYGIYVHKNTVYALLGAGKYVEMKTWKPFN